MDEEKAWKDLRNPKLCWTLLILASTITGCISISAFLSLFFLSIRIASSAIRLKIFARTAWINKYISVKTWSNSIVRKSKLNRIEFLTSKVLINSVIRHDEFDLINNVLKEYDEMKEESSKKKGLFVLWI